MQINKSIKDKYYFEERFHSYQLPLFISRTSHRLRDIPILVSRTLDTNDEAGFLQCPFSLAYVCCFSSFCDYIYIYICVCVCVCV